jgi:hypothetical protein
MNDRICACGCGDPLYGMRADAVYRSEACKKRAQRARSGDKAGTRRPSRDGNGTKVYLTFGELVHLQQARDRLDLVPTPAGGRLAAKLERACESIPEAVR